MANKWLIIGDQPKPVGQVLSNKLASETQEIDKGKIKNRVYQNITQHPWLETLFIRLCFLYDSTYITWVNFYCSPFAPTWSAKVILCGIFTFLSLVRSPSFLLPIGLPLRSILTPSFLVIPPGPGDIYKSSNVDCWKWSVFERDFSSIESNRLPLGDE